MISVIDFLTSNADGNFAAFNAKITNTSRYPMLGVKTPLLKGLAKDMAKDKALTLKFLSQEHEYFEEYLLHGLLIGMAKFSFEETIYHLEKYLPYLDNWAFCDCTVAALKIFKKNKPTLLEQVKKWLKSKEAYTVRVGVVTLLDYFIEQDYLEDIFALTKNIGGDYYIDMAVAWLYSVMLVKFYDFTVKIIEKGVLKKFIHNKTISKAVDSFRISNEKKAYLKTLRKK